MPSLLHFLQARLDEDEAAALADIHARAGHPADSPTEVASRWVPERILAECESKRRLMLGETGGDQARLHALLALPYADHPDYDDAWRPTI